MPEQHIPLEQRYAAKVQHAGDDGCWLWTGTRTPDGYGQIRAHGRRVYVHRLAYEFEHGPIADGLEVDHLCFEPRCVNPAHLEPVTRAENHRRRRGRSRRHVVTPTCPHGHVRDGNTAINARGARYCVICHRDAVRRSRARSLARKE